MAFDWGEYLAVAELLATEDPAMRPRFSTEAALRSAVSRAYYAAFCIARDFAGARLGFAARGTGGDHGALREHLRRTNRHQLARTLARLQQWRERCDYDGTDLDNGLQMALGAIDRARDVVRQFG